MVREKRAFVNHHWGDGVWDGPMGFTVSLHEFFRETYRLSIQTPV
jgi:hypothetical protein